MKEKRENTIDGMHILLLILLGVAFVSMIIQSYKMDGLATSIYKEQGYQYTSMENDLIPGGDLIIHCGKRLEETIRPTPYLILGGG